MRICIFGAGAIGGYLGGKLSLAGEEVTLIARGRHLEAMQRNGLRLIDDDGVRVARPRCTDDPARVGAQDAVIVTVKAPAAAAAAEGMLPLLAEDTAVVPAMNGIPWWYFYGWKGAWRDHRLESVDPGGRQWDLLGPERVIGCVVYPACEVVEPGVVRHIEGDRFVLGEPDGEKSERCLKLARTFVSAGLRAPLRANIRNEIWVKLWGNLAFNPLSVLTRKTLDVLATEPETRRVARAMMLEAQEIGERLGVRFPIDVDRRIDCTATVGPHKTSMLQDLERGREMEIDAILGVVQELGRLVEVETPHIDDVLDRVRQVEAQRKETA